MGTVTITDKDGKFDIGGFGTTQGAPTPDQVLHFVAKVTDGDGDFATASFSIGIDGTGIYHDGVVAGVPQSTATIAATASATELTRTPSTATTTAAPASAATDDAILSLYPEEVSWDLIQEQLRRERLRWGILVDSDEL